MPELSLLALEMSDANVVVTSILLVFAMLVVLCIIIMAQGQIFDRRRAEKSPPKPAAPAAKAAAAPAQAAAPAPAAEQGAIPNEIVAAIAAAVAVMEGEGAVIRSVRRVQPAAGPRRGAWGEAAARELTTPFL